MPDSHGLLRARIPIPTRGAGLMATFAVILELLSRLLTRTWLTGAAAAVLGALIADAALTPQISKLKVHRTAPERMRVGTPSWVELSLTPTSPRWTGRGPLLVTDVSPWADPVSLRVPYLRARFTASARLSVLPAHRGHWYDASVTTIEGRSPLGGFARRLTLPAQGPTWVHPATATPRRVPRAGAGVRSESVAAALAGRGSEPVGLREWVSGDSRNMVNWRATARRNQLVVTETARPALAPVVLAVGDHTDGPAWEAAVSVAAATAVASTRAGLPVQVATAEGTTSVSSVREVLDWFAEVDDVGPTDAEAAHRSLRAAGPGATLLWLGAAAPPPSLMTAARRAGGTPIVVAADAERTRTSESAEPTDAAPTGAEPEAARGELTGHTRRWLYLASGVVQIAAVITGALPEWVLFGTLAATVLLARRPLPSLRRLRLIRTIGAGGIGVLAIAMFTRSLTTLASASDPASRIVGYSVVLVLLSLLLGITSRTTREGRIWLAINMMVLVAAATAGQTGPDAVALTVGWLVVLAAAAIAESGRDPATPQAAIAAPPGRRQPVASGVPTRSAGVSVTRSLLLSLLASVLAFLVLPNSSGGDGLTTHFHIPGGGSHGPSLTRGSIGVDTEGDNFLDLDARGSLGDAPLLQVPASSPPLWAGSIYTTYTGQSWSDTVNTGFSYVHGNAVTLKPSPQRPVASGHRATDRATFLAPEHSSLVWAPGVPLRVRGEGGVMAGALQLGSKVRLEDAQNISSYVVTSAVPTVSPRRLEAAKGPDVSDPIWTSLPAELPATVSQLAHQITAGDTTRYAQVTALEAYLRQHEQYSLSSPVPGKGQDAVADFLFRDHVGFCEQFASAETVMLRTLGVPSRVVTGLAYGDPKGSSRVLTTGDAHAWVEVYYPGVGWSPTDPTAGATPVSVSQTGSSLVARVFHAVTGTTTSLVVVVLVLGGVAASGAGMGARLRRARRRQSAGHALDAQGQGPVLAAFLRFAGQARIRPPRAPSETAREYVDRVAGPPASAVSTSLAAAVSTLEQECYGEAPPTSGQTESAVGAFSGSPSAPAS